VGRPQISPVQQVLQVTSARHWPEKSWVDEGLVQNRQTLLRSVNVCEMEGIDLSARQFTREPGVLETGLPPLTSRVDVDGRRRCRSFALPGSHHPEVRVQVEEILEVGRSR